MNHVAIAPMFVADNNCKLWMETKHLVLETPNENEKVISTVNQSSLMDSQGKTLPSNSTKDISSISKLWCGLNVPIDVERNFESVTDEVVDEYGRFVQSKMSSTSVETVSTHLLPHPIPFQYISSQYISFQYIALKTNNHLFFICSQAKVGMKSLG